MPTFLTTSKMHPALVGRIEASVSGRRGKSGRRAKPRLMAIARLAVVLLVALLLSSVVTVHRREKKALNEARAALSSVVHGHASALTEAEKNYVKRAEAQLIELSRGKVDEIVTNEVRAPGGLTTMLARPTVYVRGPVDAFTTPTRIAEAAATSVKDALLLCLLEPPESRAEKALMGKARIAYGGGRAVEERSRHIRRLHEAEIGLPFLAPAWAERIDAASGVAEVDKLRRDLERAPIEAAKQAARAPLLLVVMDEPGHGDGPTELDGERTRYVRVSLVELASSKVLLRTRKLVDPSWISLAKREWAAGLDGCALAFDIHQSVR